MRVLVTVSIKCGSGIHLLHEIVGTTRVNSSALKNSHFEENEKVCELSAPLLELAFFLVSESAHISFDIS